MDKSLFDFCVSRIGVATGKSDGWIVRFIESWGFTQISNAGTQTAIIRLIKEGKQP